VQGEGGLVARRECNAELCRQPREQHLEPCERVFGGELMQVVENQVEWLAEPLELRQQSLDHDRAGEARCRAHPLDHLAAGRLGEGVDHAQPEPLRVTFAALDRDPRDGRLGLRGP
jgi:hypothetical protein